MDRWYQALDAGNLDPGTPWPNEQIPDTTESKIRRIGGIETDYMPLNQWFTLCVQPTSVAGATCRAAGQAIAVLDPGNRPGL